MGRREELGILLRPTAHVGERQPPGGLPPAAAVLFRDDHVAVYERKHALGVVRDPTMALPLVRARGPHRDDGPAAERMCHVGSFGHRQATVSESETGSAPPASWT